MNQDKRRRIVFVTPWWGTPRTGPEVYARYLWESFRDDTELDFHIVAASDSGESDQPNLHLTRRPAGSLALYREVARAALELCRRLPRPGILHINNSNFHSSLLASPWPIIGQVNDYESADFNPASIASLVRKGPRRYLSLWRRQILERRFARSQAVTLCNSEYTRERLMSAYGIRDKTRIRVLYKAVELSQFERPLDLAPCPKPLHHPKTILFAGTNFRIKGLDVLIEAISISAQPLVLQIAGVDEHDFEPAFPGMVGKARARGSQVHFLGRVERSRMPSLLWSSDIFCLPSRAEALGVALLEALAAGLPCVATKVGGIPEIARAVPGVVLVPPDDPIALASAIQSSLEQVRAARPLSSLAGIFGRDVMTESIRALYFELIP